MKFGGTSVGKPERMRQVSQLIDFRRRALLLEGPIRLAQAGARLLHIIGRRLLRERIGGESLHFGPRLLELIVVLRRAGARRQQGGKTRCANS